ncbi:MAG: methylornithine synthase PylB, partial [Eubacteriales bacterium]|nr:methylornithine synthase PylB [Eubacteriales bacterium]
IEYLNTTDKSEVQELFAKARKVREEHSGKKIFMYGFVYFSTFCRNDCAFCYFRKSNKIERYRKTPEEILEISRSLADSGVNLLDMTMGEDMFFHKDNFSLMLDLIGQIKKETGLPIMISPGVVSIEDIAAFARAGVEWYALYQETHNREIFEKLRLNQSYDERMNAKLYAKDCGMHIEEGLLAGVGESNEDIADSIITMGEIGAHQVRVMSFIPQEGSPMETVQTPDRAKELKIIALMRIMYPWALIPASLDVDGIKGLEDRINAGANLVTSIIPPKSGLAGVAHSDMDVDNGGRTVAEAKAILEKMGLEGATAEEYREYLNKALTW